MTSESPPSHSFLTALRVGTEVLRQHPLLAAGFVATTLAQGALQALLIWSLRFVLLRLSGAEGTASAALVLGTLLILGLWTVRSAATMVGQRISVRLARGSEISSMRRVIAKLLTLPVRFFDRSSQGDLVMAVYQDLKGIRTVTLGLGTMLLSLSRVCGLAAVAWILSPVVAAIGLSAALVGVVPAYWIGRRITQASLAERGSVRSLYDSFLQVLHGIRVIKVNRGEEAVLRHATETGQRLYRFQVRHQDDQALARFLLEAISGVGVGAVLVVGGRDVAAGTLEWQSLLSMLVAIMAMYAPVINVLAVYGQVRGVIPNLDRIRSILTYPVELADAPDAVSMREPPRVIQLDDVSFAYDGETVLDCVSATFYAGETIGIVGPSGAGKSTLIALMLRLYDPSQGRVLCDGIDLRRIRHADLMEKCAIVLQEPFLFIDTVANNIRIARPRASMEEVIEAAKAAEIHDFIMTMPAGYETVVGSRADGRGVSVGQKQRICIAAALLKNAPILFLDEATSSLDSVSERSVQAAIDRLMAGRTTFVIAHRLSTLRTAHRILVMDKGRMVDLGTHDELLTRCVTYQRLWRHQQAEPEWLPESESRAVRDAVM